MNFRTLKQNADLHRLLALVPMVGEKEELVLEHTDGRTSSSKEMYDFECQYLIEKLAAMDEDLHSKSRKKVLHLLRLLGWTYTEIDNYIKNMGANNPKKKSLNNLGGLELNNVVTQVNALYTKETNRDGKTKATRSRN